MKISTIVLSDSDSSNHNRSPEEIVATLKVFMPIIDAVDHIFAIRLKDENRLMWNVRSLSYPDASGQLGVFWMASSKCLGYINMDDLIKGSICMDDQLICRGSTTINVSPGGCLSCDGDAIPTLDEAVRYIIENLLREES